MYEPVKLEARRKKLKLGFPQLAQRSKVNYYTVKNFFRGGTGQTTTAEAILGALEIPIESEHFYRRRKRT